MAMRKFGGDRPGEGHRSPGQRIAHELGRAKDAMERPESMRAWLASYFVARGSFRITAKALAELVEDKRVQHMEFAEDYSSREREERIERSYPEGKLRLAEARKIISDRIRDGRAQELIDSGHVVYVGSWVDRENRTAAIEKLIQIIGKKPGELTQDDYQANGLAALLGNHYNNSPYLALVECGHAHSLQETREHAESGKFSGERLYPWQMNNARIYHEREIRVAATKWLLWKSGKAAREISVDDYYENGLRGLQPYYGGSSYLALAEAGLAHGKEDIAAHAAGGKFEGSKAYPWELKNAPLIYGDLEMRVAATKWLLWKTGKGPREITRADFMANGLAGLDDHYKDSHFLAFVESGHAYSAREIEEHSEACSFGIGKIYPWEAARWPKQFSDRSMKIAAVRWLVWKTGKEPAKIVYDDFVRNGLSGLISHYGDSTAKALEAAGLR